MSSLWHKLPGHLPAQPASASNDLSGVGNRRLDRNRQEAQMHGTQVLTLVLALSCALNIAFIVGITARYAGASIPQAVLTAAGTVGTFMAIFFAAVSAYR